MQSETADNGKCYGFDNDSVLTENDQFQDEVAKLKEENRLLVADFDTQRAKMKELFLLQENELLTVKEDRQKLQNEVDTLSNQLEETKNQLLAAEFQLKVEIEEEKRKAYEQILTLESLVNESNANQNHFSDEVTRLKSINEKLQTDYQDLKSVVQQSSPRNEGGKNLKFGSLTRVISDVFTQPEKEKADDELLKSILTPLEEEVKQLKVKLRETDAELQNCRNCVNCKSSKEFPNTNLAVTNDGQVSECEICKQLKLELEEEKVANKNQKTTIESSEQALSNLRNDLDKEIDFRKEMEQKWTDKRERYREQVTNLRTKIQTTEREFQDLKSNFSHAYNEIMEQLINITQDREETQKHLIELQNENDHLMAKYDKFSSQIHKERVDIGDNVEALHAYLLRKEQELIQINISREALLEQVQKLNIEKSVLEEKVVTLESIEIQLNKKIDLLNNKINSDPVVQELKKYKKMSVELTEACEKKTKERDDLEKLNFELKGKLTNYQNELETSEMVQKDFVRLSQSLQVQLEKIRTADSQVRWQYKEDVDKCSTCHQVFMDESRKVNCRHCGQVFCFDCLNKIVYSGPRKRETKVCDVCHTLLVQSSAPYFSNEISRSPN